jgi:hypothetical protein
LLKILAKIGSKGAQLKAKFPVQTIALKSRKFELVIGPELVRLKMALSELSMSHYLPAL